MMDLRDAIKTFVNDARDITDRLRVEGEALSTALIFIFWKYNFICSKKKWQSGRT
jgi:hypothetical protein